MYRMWMEGGDVGREELLLVFLRNLWSVTLQSV